jgi:hypothetical protein
MELLSVSAPPAEPIFEKIHGQIMKREQAHRPVDRDYIALRGPYFSERTRRARYPRVTDPTLRSTTSPLKEYRPSTEAPSHSASHRTAPPPLINASGTHL